MALPLRSHVNVGLSPAFVAVAVNVTVSPAQLLLFERLRLTFGVVLARTTISLEYDDSQPSPVCTVSVTVYVPAFVNVWTILPLVV